MAHQIKNNFLKLKEDFKLDTKLDADQNMVTYIQYVNARMTDRIVQYNHFIITEMVNKLDQMPGVIRTQMAEMIRTLKTEGVI